MTDRSLPFGLYEYEASRATAAAGPSGAADRRLLNWAEHNYPRDAL